MISKHLDKNNLHHAYLIEGEREESISQVLEFVKDLGIDTEANSDFINISIDSFKIEDTRNLKSYASEKSLSIGKKIFLISVNNILLEAQQSLLKMFEEPIENTHFFLVVPDANSLLKTLVSRFYVIREKSSADVETAEKFIGLSLQKRIDFVKELLVETDEEDEEGNEIVALDSTRSKALRFLNALELTLHQKFMSKVIFDITFFEHIFKVREFLRMPGSSVKTLVESVALVTPIL